MILLFHILVACSSIGFTGFTYFYPSRSKLSISYGLIGVTLVSGTYLVFTTHTQILQTCITGLVYLGIVLSAIVLARKKLISAQER